MEPLQIWAPLPNTLRSQAAHLSAHGDRLVYCNGKSVFVRHIDDPAETRQFTEHKCTTTAASISPSGYYVASGDINGTVRVWDASKGTVKTETAALSGRVNDIAWDGESKRIIAVGNGKERYGHCFTFDTANTIGEISGHSAVVNTASIRHQRPFRAITAGDDHSIVFHTAFPTRFERILRVHKRFVHEVRYAPDGDVFASVAGDGMVCIFDGNTGDLKATLEGHEGSVFAVSFDPSSKRILTSSADRTARLWDLQSEKLVQTWEFGDHGIPSFQQVGNAFIGNRMISLSLSGDLNFLDANSNKSYVLSGHQRGITSIQKKDDTFFTGSYDGRIRCWSKSGVPEIPLGWSHEIEVVGFASCKDRIFSAGKDDVVQTMNTKAETLIGSAISCKGQPRGLATLSNGALMVITDASITVYKDGEEIATLLADFTPSAVSISSDGLVAVGSEDHSIHVFEFDTQLKPCFTLESNRFPITALAFHPKSLLLAAGDGGGKVVLYDTSQRSVVTSRWGFQNGRVMHLEWNEAGSHVASASLDTSVALYSVEKPLRHLMLSRTHKEGASGVVWVDCETLATVGADGTVKKWRIRLP